MGRDRSGAREGTADGPQSEFDCDSLGPQAFLRKRKCARRAAFRIHLCATERSTAGAAPRLPQACGRTHRRSVMSLGVWIAVGLFTGFLASKLVIKTGDGLLLDVGLGI